MNTHKIFGNCISGADISGNFHSKSLAADIVYLKRKPEKKYHIGFGVALIFFAFIINGCKKLVEVDGPSTSLNSEILYQNDLTAASVLTGVYANMSSSNLQQGNLLALSYLTGLSSDELTLYNGTDNAILSAYYTNNLNNQIVGSGFWGYIYQNLYIINSALEGVSNSDALTTKVKQQLIGEARFMRALCFFYLVNLYGDVPLTVTTDYKLNSTMPRTAKIEVYHQIISDLIEAQKVLSEDYLDASLLTTTEERVRPTKSAATALLSRVYLYVEDWENAEIQATEVLNNPRFKLVNLNEVFAKNNMEAIWQLQGVKASFNTQEAVAFIITPDLGLSETPVYLSEKLLNSFDQGDLRKGNWINTVILNGTNYTYAYKYKIGMSNDLNAPVYEYSTVLRLSEQYLIRAEARIQQNKIADGITDLNILRDRATDKNADPSLQLKLLPTNMAKEDALFVTEKERRIELFTEWGHRWFDLKRTGRIDAVMAQQLPDKVPGGIWNSYQQLFPIELLQLQRNPKLVQNPGY